MEPVVGPEGLDLMAALGSPWFWVFLVMASTLLLKQHFIVDVVAGVILAAAAMTFVRPWIRKAVCL